MIRLLLPVITLLFFTASLKAQSAYPQDYFTQPISGKLLLSGSFSELRSTHFHGGIDIKTNGKTGMPVIAIADGYVSRIKISPYGYGNALYLNHPNGYTSVYGHLQEFTEPLKSYVRNRQYLKESFEIELFFKAGQFPVKKGDTIAFSGNTGSSGGPHLHFEIRETKSEWTVNPLLFGITVNDHISPIVSNLKIESFDAHQPIEILYAGKNGNYTKSYAHDVLLPLVKRNGQYYARGVQQVFLHGPAGISVSVFDKMNGSSNKLDIYKISLYANGQIIFQQERNSFAFDHSSYLYALSDYEFQLNHSGYLQRCFLLPNNKLPFYTFSEGIIHPSAGDTIISRIECEDFYQNQSVINLSFIGQAPKEIEEVKDEDPFFSQTFYYNQKNNFESENISFHTPILAFFDDVPFTFSKSERRSPFVSEIYHIGNPKYALAKSCHLGIKNPGIRESLMSKVLIVRVDKKKIYPQNTQLSADYFVTKVKKFGSYALMLDTLAPAIRPLNFKNGSVLPVNSILKVKITDDLSGIKDYRCEIDGKWELMTYDGKNNLLLSDWAGRISKGWHTLDLIVKDVKGNEKTYSAKIRFY